jgi:hypothetical protein
MSKIVKLKQSDIEKIVNNILKESNGEFDDFDTQIQPEELPDDQMDLPSSLEKFGIDPSELDFEGKYDTADVLIGKDQNGNIVVTDTNTGKTIKAPN